MSSTFDVKSLPLFRQISLLGGVLLFISLFFPWWSASVDFGDFGSTAGSASGWNGIGTLVGLLVIVLIAWEVLRVLGQAGPIQFNHDLITAGLAGLIALFGVIQFIRALTYGGVDAPGISAGPGFGAFLILIFSLGLGYAAFLAFQAAGGQAALKEARGQVQGDSSGDATGAATAPAPETAAPSAPAAPAPGEAGTSAETSYDGETTSDDDGRPSSQPPAAG